MATTTRSMGSGCLALFALPFAAVGVGMSIWLFTTLGKVWSSRNWTETPAYILETELHTSRGSGKNKSTTYRCDARYTYEFNGQKFESTRVSFYGGSDNFGSFQKDAHAELSRYVPRTKPAAGIEYDPAAHRAEPFRCYVNPANPAEAVLYREIRLPFLAFQAVFALVFGGVGFGLLAAGLFGRRIARSEAELRKKFPAEPWKWKTDWASGIIHADRSAGVFLLIFAIFWNLIALPAGWIAITQGIKTGQHAAWFVLIFPVIGVLIAAGAIHALLRRRKFGHMVFQMGSVPGVIGGKLAGLIRLPLKLHTRDGFHLTLKCTRSVTTGTGKHRRTEQIVLHSAEQHIKADASRSLAETAIPVLFPIPYGLPPSDPVTIQPIVWNLTVTADNPGIDLHASFDLPVFQTPESSPDYVHDDRPIRPFLA